MGNYGQYFGQKNSDVLPYNPYTTSDIGNNPAEIEQFNALVNSPVPANQAKYGNRTMIKWLVPERGIIEMYINPQSLRITKPKIIKSERTKGGFVIQYFGEDLIDISIEGHTGSAGIEGINILDQIYRAEQIAFDVVALEEYQKALQEESLIFGVFAGLEDVVSLAATLSGDVSTSDIFIPNPTLGYYAATIEMYWQGEIYKGFFTNLTITESVSKLGVFDYNLNFKATQKRGYRRNYLPWHKVATAGPSNHDTIPFYFSSNEVPTTSQDELVRNITNR